jgi:hypothetical protein
MSSLRRIAASRANGRLSQGPKTPAGKQRSSLNAIRHGLLSKVVVLSNERGEGFDKLLEAYVDRFGPVDPVEFGLIEEMAASWWRIRRAWAIEKSLLESGLERHEGEDDVVRIAAAFRELAATPDLAGVHRYETRLHKMYQRSLHNLLLMRQAVPNEPSPISGHQLPEPDSPPVIDIPPKPE